MPILFRGKTYKLQARAGALALLCVFGWLLAGPAGAQVYSPSPWLRPDQINVLAAVDASRPEALRPAARPRHLKGTVRNWTREDQFLREMQAYGATPIINVLIVQDGTLAPRSLAVMRDFAHRVGGQNAPSSARRANE